MKIANRHQKWLKGLLALVITLALIAGGLLYIINYRVRDILQIVIDKESKGVYGFDAAAVDISLLQRNIVIKKAVLFCKDTLHTSPHYNVKIPQLYLAIQSWRALLFHKKVTVDSLSVLDPEVSSHEHFAQKNKPVSFEASAITNKIEKLLLQLQVRSFHIQNASFVFSRLNNPVPLLVNHINFSILNFSKKSNRSNRLFSSDDIDLSIDNQHWVLPDGHHDIGFKRLHFSGKDQFFELDSCTFRTAMVPNKGGMALTAEKLFFNATQLTALYEQDALLIDTLICFRPVLNIITTNKTDTNNARADTTSVNQLLAQLFTNINFKYIDVRDGELSVINKYRPNYLTQKANLKAYNLHISRQGTPPITTDSMQLNLKNLQFLTADSLFQLTVAEFNMRNNDVLFKDAVYEPTARNHADKGFTFTAPTLHLKNINLAALMNKKLVADTAELGKPVITVYDKSKKSNKNNATIAVRQAKIPPGKKKNFYQTLHGLNELIAVQHFNILHGSLGFTAAGAAPLQINMRDLNASILLNNLFRSDSLIDIKRSLPECATGLITVQSPQLQLIINNYTFRGDRRHNNAGQFQLSLANGTVVNGKQLYWEVLDWDMFVNHKIIQVDYLKLNELAIHIRKKSPPAEAQIKNNKDLPVINISRIDLDHIDFSDSSAKAETRFSGKDICVDNIGSAKKFFTWNNAEGIFSNLSLTGGGTKTITVNSIGFNTQYGTTLREMKIDIRNERGYTKAAVPDAKLVTDIHSTDFSSIHVNKLEADNAVIDIYKKQAPEKQATASKPLAMPVALVADRLAIKKASVKYTAETPKDTLALTTAVTIDASSVNTYKQQQNLLTYEKLMIGLSELRLNKGHLDLAIPQSSLALTKGNVGKNAAGKAMLRTVVLLQWMDASMQLQQTDSTGIIAGKLAGSFSDAAFQVYPNMKIKWPSLVSKAAITSGNGTYRGKNITASAGAIAWNPLLNKLNVRSFSVLPNLGIKETFNKPGAWQGDYMTIKGEAMDISGIQYSQQEGDSSLTVKKIVLDSMSLTTTRDKRMPFKHGAEKPMPVAMINAIKIPLRVDSVLVRHSHVTVNEIAIKSEKQGTVPLNDIDAVITNFKNRRNSNDSLTVVANARLLNYKISNFYYKEAYGDSLSYFYADVHVSSMALNEFSTVTIPLASVGVDNGNADTLFARWTGNKYAAAGRMDFYYKGLKIRLLDAKDNSKKKLLLSLGNFAAGLLLHKNNSETSRMFFVRDREKFIFNYWVKTILAGISTSAGIKRNKKMLKNYQSMKTQYSLPVFYD